ncbi:hypothetical protein KAR91_10800 [Candidatus Pacearchaeota archaeon]|nr:hypothetical protein [Candidatus Pacearchaeota archaeon]
MALVKYGGGIIQMSGSIAGNTFAKNRYGNYIRARTKPVNPNSAAQVDVRAIMAVLVERWAETLTIAQRAAWQLYADNVVMTNKLGESIKLSGFNHYIRSNAVKVRQAYPATDAGPVVFTLPDHDPILAIAGSEATQQITVTYDDTLAWDTETGGHLWLWQGAPQNAQRNFFGGPWKYMAQVPGVDGAPVASPLVSGVAFAIAEGQRQWVYARIERADGRISTPFRADVITAA